MVRAKREFKAGQKIKITGDVSGHQLPIGSVHELGGRNGVYWTIGTLTLGLRNLTESEFEATATTRAELLEQIKEIEEQAAEVKVKIDYLRLVQQEVFSETEFKAFRTLAILRQEGLTELQRAQAIARLIDGE